MGNRGRRISAAEIAVLLALLAWGIFPIVLLLIHAAARHATFTGADGLIGADGVLGADQLQYLAWARDAGLHGLASDLFTLAPNGHVYLEPVFTITGLLWRAGLSLPFAYLIWKPIAALALWAAAVVWARRAFREEAGARLATVVLAVFLYTPLAALVSWTSVGGKPFRFQLYLLGDELLSAGKLWGYVPSAIALALVVAALLSAERALAPDPRLRPGLGGLTWRVRIGPLGAAAACALLAAWLHPWQGITMVLVFLGLGVWQRHQGGVAMVAPAAGAGIALGYYYLLGHSDPAWHLASQQEIIPRLEPLVLLAGFGPLILFGIFGLRHPRGSVFEQVLLLWIVACFITYFVNDAFAPHALQGLSFPLAVLAVRGWRRLRLPAALAILVLLVATVPGLTYNARKFARTAATKHVQYYIPRGDERAMRWIASTAPAGGILAPPPVAILVPSQTGRRVWVGHGYWSQDYASRRAEANRFFWKHMPAPAARRFVLGTGASLVFDDCAHRRDLGHALAPIVSSVHRFGCARVYVLARRRSARR